MIKAVDNLGIIVLKGKEKAKIPQHTLRDEIFRGTTHFDLINNLYLSDEGPAQQR